MIAEGLLWYDDDPRTPFSAKMAEAARRFSERTGWAPTACEANPQMLALREAVPTTGRSARAKAERAADAGAPRLAVTANASLRPNYILVGVEVGKTPRPARKLRPTRAEQVERAAAAKSVGATPTRKRAAASRPVAQHAAPTPPTSSAPARRAPRVERVALAAQAPRASA